MLKTIILISSVLVFGGLYAYKEVKVPDLSENENKEESSEVKSVNVYQVESQFLNDSISLSYVNTFQLYEDDWAQLAHPNFWKQVMRLSPDSCIVNKADTREVITQLNLKEWHKLSDSQKNEYRDSIRKANGMTASDRLFFTTGKADFYDYTDVLETISRGVLRFQEQDVDPWYAQAILMIESPGKIAKSSAGAYGSFQLMPGVARNVGLTVNKTIDERKDFDKSAVGASKLIARICIPEAKKILDKRGIEYEESDLWFRLFVMHIYHAGAGNVSGVINKIDPTEGGIGLIQKMWVTENGSFRNASQNYSQLALASMMILEDILWGC